MISRHPYLLRFLVGLFCLQLSPVSSAQDSDLFGELTTIGIPFSNETRVKLALPTLNENQSTAELKQAVEKLAGKQEWSRFARNSVSAPVTILIEPINGPDNNKLGLNVHNAFIVYAKLDALKNAELMAEIFGRPGKSAETKGVVTEELSKELLQQAGFTEQSQSPASFAYIELPLLNKVLVRGVIRIEKRELPGSIEFFWRLDASFGRVEKYASRWTKLQRDPVGKLIEGESFPYTGCGGFLGVYSIDRENDQLLVESRMLLKEPDEWFAGSNFLRSKLPPAMQENARNFRRKLAEQVPSE